MLKSLTLSGISYGVLVSGILAVASFLSLSWAANKSHTTFQAVLFGGLLLRLIIAGIATVWVWEFTAVDGLSFVVGLLSSYFVLQVIETIFLQRILKRTAKRI